MEFGDEDLNEGGLVATDRVDVVGESVNVSNPDVDGESADDSPLGFGWEASERVDERPYATTPVAHQDDLFTRHG